MTDKKRTQRNRAIALSKIRMSLPLFYQEDLLQLQQAIVEAWESAGPAPAEDQLVAPGEWLEERHIQSKLPGMPGRYYVYLRRIDDAGRERGSVVYRGTLAQYKAARLSSGEDMTDIRT